MGYRVNKQKLLDELKKHLEESYEILENSKVNGNIQDQQEIGVNNCLELYIAKIEGGDYEN